MGNHKDIVKLLLDKAADVNARVSFGSHAGHELDCGCRITNCEGTMVVTSQNPGHGIPVYVKNKYLC